MKESSQFSNERERLNRLMLDTGNLTIKRFMALDTDAYLEGAISKKYKELLGLVASTVLRCDDCIAYHIDRAHEEGASEQEIAEALSIALVVGGSITVPHVRAAFAQLRKLANND